MHPELVQYFDAEHETYPGKLKDLFAPCWLVVQITGNNSRIPLAIFSEDGEEALAEFLSHHPGCKIIAIDKEWDEG